MTKFIDTHIKAKRKLGIKQMHIYIYIYIIVFF